MKAAALALPHARVRKVPLVVTWHNAVTDVALYAACIAAGDTEGARRAMSAAQAQEASYPTYYGSAWVALAPLMLNGSLAGYSS